MADESEATRTPKRARGLADESPPAPATHTPAAAVMHTLPPDGATRTISPFADVPDGMNRARVLLVGIDGVGKRTLGRALNATSSRRSPLALTLSTAAELPLEGSAALRADFIVCLCSQASLLSFESTLRTIAALGTEMVLGRVCIVLSHTDARAATSFSHDELRVAADTLGFKLFTGDLSSARVAEHVATMVRGLVALASRARGHSSWLLSRAAFKSTMTRSTIRVARGAALDSSVDSTPPVLRALGRTGHAATTPGRAGTYDRVVAARAEQEQAELAFGVRIGGLSPSDARFDAAS